MSKVHVHVVTHVQFFVDLNSVLYINVHVYIVEVFSKVQVHLHHRINCWLV